MRTSSPAARRKRRAGFTLIEVMVSLGIMTVGAMAVISLQQHAIRANVHSRQLTIATQIAQRWVERLKQDTHSWTQVATTANIAAVLADTQVLKRIESRANEWQEFPLGDITPTRSNAFDYLGYDTNNGGDDYVYCAAFRPAWVYFGRAMRIDVRVFWKRAGTAGSIRTDFANCNGNQGDINPGGTLFNQYHVVYLSTVLRMTPVIR